MDTHYTGTILAEGTESKDYPRVGYQWPRFEGRAWSEMFLPTVTEAVLQALPGLLASSTLLHDAVAQAVAQLALLRVGDTVNGRLFTTEPLPTSDNEYITKLFLDMMLEDKLGEVPMLPDGQSWVRQFGEWVPAEEGGGGGGVGPAGPAGPTGPAGPAGAAGQQGPAGVAGAAGATGPAGQQGVAGPAGPAGTGINILGSIAGNGPPASPGTDQGDAYIASGNGHIWVWSGSAWVDAGQIQGPAGPAGAQGNPGTNGAPGAAATVTVGTTSTGPANVTNSGTTSAAVLNFTVPQGPQGTAGTNGAAATVAVGTVNTGAAGTTASVLNSGTTSAAVLNFTIPRGDVGATGPAFTPTQTGTGSTFVVQQAPTLNQPVIMGTTDGTAAASGEVGQLLAVNGSTGTIASVTPITQPMASVSVPAGRWLVWGQYTLSATSMTNAMAYMDVTATGQDIRTPGAGALASTVQNTGAFWFWRGVTGIAVVSQSATQTFYCHLGAFNGGTDGGVSGWATINALRFG